MQAAGRERPHERRALEDARGRGCTDGAVHGGPPARARAREIGPSAGRRRGREATSLRAGARSPLDGHDRQQEHRRAAPELARDVRRGRRCRGRGGSPPRGRAAAFQGCRGARRRSRGRIFTVDRRRLCWTGRERAWRALHLLCSDPVRLQQRVHAKERRTGAVLPPPRRGRAARRRRVHGHAPGAGASRTR